MLKTTAQKETNKASANLGPNRGQSFFAAASGPVIQPKLTINNPNDEYEREADAMADKVMRMENPGIQLKPLLVTSVQRKCTHCEEEEKKPVQRKEMNTVDLSLFNPDKNNKVTADRLPSQHRLVIQRKCAACEAEQKKELQRKEMNGQEATADSSLENYIGNLNNGGQSLSNEVRNFYEPRFGYDFSQVKVHTGNVAAKSANSINALAYTSGNHIVFNNRQYAPDTDSGKRLLSHELTHVVQQGRKHIQGKLIQRFCTPAATCAAPIPGSAAGFVDEEARRQAAAVARRRRMTPARALSTGHGGHARQLEIFLESQAPGRLASIQGIFLDMDISPNFGAFHQPCADWISEALPPGTVPHGMAGASRTCVFVPAALNQQALQFNTTSASTIAGQPRDDWRVGTLAILTHETQHAIFAGGAHGTPAGITSASCTRAAITRELTELSAILSEFPVLSRAIPAGAAATHSSRIRLADWFQFEIIDSPESIKGILQKIGCSCNCPEVDGFVIDTFNFTTTSWTPAERTAFNTELNRAVWGIRWPIPP